MQNYFRGLSFVMLALSISFFTACSGQSAEKSNSTPGTTETAPAEQPAPAAPGEMKIDVSELVELMQEEPNLQLLDVRTPEEVAQGFIKGAKVINIRDADFATKAADILDKTKPLAVYCAAGSRSSSAIPKLKEQGFTMLYNLEGGIQAWIASGQAVVK
jgi:rhodanese-related sulfurtransferase